MLYAQLSKLQGFTVAQTVNRRRLNAELQFRSLANPCLIYGGQSGTGTGFSLSPSVSPVIIRPPVPHGHPVVYHRRCINSAVDISFKQHI